MRVPSGSSLRIADFANIATGRSFDSRIELVSWASVNTPRVGFVASAPGRLFRYIGTGTAISDLPGWEPYGELSFGHWLMTTNDTGNNADSILEALTYAAGRQIKGQNNAIYRLTSTVNYIGSVNIDWNRARIHVDANVRAFKFDADLEAVVPLTANYAAGDLTLSVTSTGTALAASRMVKIVTNGVDPANRDEGSATEQWRTAEWFDVAPGSTTTQIALVRPLRLVYSIDPSSMPGDEPRVLSYTTALNARVCIPKPATFRMDNLKLYYTDGHDEDLWNQQGVVLTWYQNPEINNMEVYRGYNAALVLSGTARAVVNNCFMSNLTNNTLEGQFGYGVQDGGFSTVVNYGVFENCRHGYTTGAAHAPLDYTNSAVLSGVGRTMGARINYCEARGFSAGASALDTHADAEDVIFSNCRAVNCADYGFSARGRNITFVNPQMINCFKGIQFLTEYGSGSPGDDFFLAGKRQSDFTSGRIINPYFDVQQSPMVINHATVLISDAFGSVGSHNFLEARGDVTLSGTWRLKTSNGDGAREITVGPGAYTGMIQITELNAAADVVFAHNIVRLSDGCHIRMDGTGGVGEPRLLKLGVGGEFVQRGRIETTLPATTVELVTSSGECSGNGLIYFNVAGGAAGNSIPVGSPDTLNITSTDHTVALGDSIDIVPYATRASFVTRASLLSFTVGTVFFAEGLAYRYIGSGTAISDLPGWVPQGVYEPGHFAPTSTTDYTSAINAMFNLAYQNAAQWRISKAYPIAGQVICYSAGDGRGGELQVTAALGTPYFVVAAPAADINAVDTALVAAANALGGWFKGQDTFPTLGGWKGKSIRLASPDTYLLRSGGSVFRHELTFQVLDAEGKIWPPMPFDVGAGVVFTTGVTTVARSPITIDAPTIRVIAASSGAGSLVTVSRPNTIINGLTIRNDTATKFDSGILHAGGCAGVTLNSPSIEGMLENATNYGIQIAGSGLYINNPLIYNCRRGFDASYGYHIRVFGGTFADGAGAHLGFDYESHGTDYGCDAPNTAPLFWSGGDVKAYGGVMRSHNGNFLSTRSDILECIGNMHLVGVTCILTDSTQTVIKLTAFDTPGSIVDPGKDVQIPSHVLVANNTVRIPQNAAWAGDLKTFHIDPLGKIDPSRDLIINTKVQVFGNDIPMTAVCYVNAIREDNWTGGGLKFAVRDVPNLTAYLSASVAAGALTATRHELTAEVNGPVTVRSGGGGLSKYNVSGTTFVYSAAASSAALIGDEVFLSSVNGSPRGRDVALAANTAAKIAMGNNFATFCIAELNAAGAALWCDFIVDGSGAAGIVIKGSGGATWAASTAVLTGTTGTSGNMTVSINGGYLYIENQTASTHSFRFTTLMAY